MNLSRICLRNKPDMELMENLTDVVRTGGLVVGFLLLCVLGDRDLWMTADMLVAVGTGLALILCPQCLIQFQVCVLSSRSSGIRSVIVSTVSLKNR